ncbi:hypothetical protein [Thiohalorhabdus methylotrophus]|uniref:Uncharacterized protein n=1 Tax=Thiohalorhabdus methylotrophus TaxID=3242694 RepID=A0ABV4TPY2_9GAMM
MVEQYRGPVNKPEPDATYFRIPGRREHEGMRMDGGGPVKAESFFMAETCNGEKGGIAGGILFPGQRLGKGLRISALRGRLCCPGKAEQPEKERSL